MGIAQCAGELVAVGKREAETLPERSGPTAEQPGALRSEFRRPTQGELREPGSRPHALGGRVNGHTPDECMPSVRAEFEPRARDDSSRLIALDPDVHGGGVETAQGQVDVSQKLDEFGSVVC